MNLNQPLCDPLVSHPPIFSYPTPPQDKVIHYLSQDGRLNAFYSTPSAYAAAKLEKGKTYSLNSYDMMPYSDGDHSYVSENTRRRSMNLAARDDLFCFLRCLT